ncbi:MAG: hypothetical protein B7733_06310 [Myxococcales bacterium FL481]|nr:MAG: hypothetical protein B7733_06310 [Myxococcales bacterium FL481]
MAVHRGLSGKPKDTEFDRFFEEFTRAGAKMDWIEVQKTPEQILSSFTKTTKSLTDGRQSMLSAARAGWQAWSDVAASTENGTRLLVYIAARKSGISVDRAAIMAKEATTNFEQRGEWGSGFTSMYMFWNASVQGTVQIARSFARNPKAWTVMVGKLFATQMALQYLLRAWMGDEYDRLPEHVREGNTVLPTGTETFITIPLPWVYNVAANMGRHTMDVMLGEMGAEEATVKSIATFVASVNPFGGDPFQKADEFKDLTKPENVVLALTPTVGKLPVGLSQNMDGLNRPIRPDDFGNRPESNAHKFAWAEKPYPAISQWINARTGGDEVEGGFIDIHPDDLEHMWQFLTGTAGATAQRFYGLTRGEKVPLREVPFLRRMMSQPSEWHESQEYRRNLDELEIMEERIRIAAEKKDPVGLRKVKRSDPKLWNYYFSSGWKEMRSAVKRLHSEARKAETPEREKIIREAIKRLQSKMNTKMAEALDQR